MFRLLKWLLGLVVTLFTLILLVVIIVPMVFDPNDYRDEITALVKEQTGRDLTLDGDLDISVFPWLGIRTSGLRFSQPPQIGGDMIRVDQAQLRVKLAPLLSKQVQVDTIVLETPEIRLVTLPSGVDSFYGLTEDESASETDRSKNAEPNTSSDAGVAIVLQGIELTDGSVRIEDRSEQSVTQLSELNLVTGNLLGDRFATLEANGGLVSSDSQDPILFDLAGLARINAENVSIQMKDLAGEIAIGSEKVAFELASVKFSEQSNIELTGVLADLNGSLTARVSLPSLVANLDTQRAEISVGELSSGELLVKISDLIATNFIDALSVSANVAIPPFNAVNVLKELEIDYQPTNPNSLQRVGLDARLLANLDKAEIKDLSVILDNSRLKGEGGVVNFDKPEITFDLLLDELNLDDYLPSGDDEETTYKSSAVGANALSMPVQVFKELQANGQVRSGRFIFGGIELNNIDVQVRSTQRSVTITPTASLYDGELAGQITFLDNNGSTRLTLENEVDLVQLGELLDAAEITDQLSGLGSVLVDLVVTEQDGVQTNTGVIRLQAKDGAIQGVDVKSMIDSAWAQYQSLRGREPAEVAEGKSKVSDETHFAEILGTFKLNNNVITNDDFSVKAPLFRVGGSGTIDLAEQSLDYLVEVKLVPSTDGQGGKSINELVGIPIPIRLSGDLMAPSYSIDLKQLYRSLLKRKVDQKKGELLQKKLGIEGGESLSTKSILKSLLREKLDEKLRQDKPHQERSVNGRSQDTQADESEAPTGGDAEEFPKSAEDKLKEELKNKLLDGLFGSQPS